MKYTDMVAWIRQNTERRVKEGIRYVTKRIPDREGLGILDPRLLESARGGVGISYPQDNQKITEQELALMRAEIGAVNYSVTEGELLEESFVFGKAGVCKYRPVTKEKLPVLIYIHGGGFLGGSVSMCENFCRDLARTAPAAVFSVSYRLAPQDPYPAALEDCFDAVDGIFSLLDEETYDVTRVLICGDSAGGKSGALLLYARGRSGKPENQKAASFISGGQYRKAHAWRLCVDGRLLYVQ